MHGVIPHLEHRAHEVAHDGGQLGRFVGIAFFIPYLIFVLQGVLRGKLALWLLFVSAMALGTQVRLWWYQLAAALWFGSYLAAPHLTGHLPLWLLALLTGAVTILAAVDNIHASTASGPARHRIILLLTGAVLCGSALGLHQPGLMASTRGWMALLLVCAVAAAAIMSGLRVVARSGRRPCTQLASLACCGGAIFSMLRLLEVV